jgi:DNA-binding MarR family transcriptional regulator
LYRKARRFFHPIDVIWQHQDYANRWHPVDARLLENLYDEGNSISVVARRADMTKRAVGALAMALERRGYVIRSGDKSDGRIWRLRFTRKG